MLRMGDLLVCCGLGVFELLIDFCTPQMTKSSGIPRCSRTHWAFSEEFLCFVPFFLYYPTFFLSKKGTKIRNWQENAQKAGKRAGKPSVFRPLKGTNLVKISKNARGDFTTPRDDPAAAAVKLIR